MARIGGPKAVAIVGAPSGRSNGNGRPALPAPHGPEPARGRCFDHPAGEHQPHLHHCRAPLGQRLPMPSRSHLALRRVAASDRQPSTGCPQGRDGGRVQRGTAGRLSVGSAPDVGRVCTSPYRELAPRTEDTRGLPRLGMYYRNLLTTQTSERGATGQARPSSAAGTSLGVRPLEEAHGVVERGRLVLLAEHDPEAKEDPLPPWPRGALLLVSSARQPSSGVTRSKPKICSAVASSVKSVSSSPGHPSGRRSLCSGDRSHDPTARA